MSHGFCPALELYHDLIGQRKKLGMGCGAGADWLHFVGLRSFEMGGEGPREVWSIPDATELRNIVSTLAANAGMGESLIRGKSTTFPASL